VVVTDFGIARAQAHGESDKTMGRAVGTPAYMAPEQVSGAKDIDARADIYAFGAILFEMLTGERAWPGSSAVAVAAARLLQPPPDPRKHRPALSTSLADITLRCLAREREQRFASDAELDRALAAEAAATGTADATAETAPAGVRVARALAETGERTVAVIPFRNLGPPEDAYLVEGLVEDLVDTLATVRGLRVRAHANVEPSERDVAEVGRRPGVDVVVEGSVRRAASTLRVNARLIGVADGFQLWSSRFDRPAADAFALNDEVARAIAEALAAKHEEPPRAPPTDPAAIDLYFRAKYAISTFWRPNGAAEAAELFERVVQLAPNDPTILAGYVHAQIGRNFFTSVDPNKAKSFVQRALSAAPRLPEPWVALAAVRFNHRDDPPGAVRALRNALALGPSSSDAHDLAGRILLEADAWDDALAHLERALWLDPRQRWARNDRMRAAALTGDWARAQEVFDSAPDGEWRAHRTIDQARLWLWPGAPPIAMGEVPPGIDARFVGTVKMYVTTYEDRAAGRGRPAPEVRAPLEDHMKQSLPEGRGRRFYHQLMAEQLLHYGHAAEALDAVAASVKDGLVDAAWMTRLRLLDPLRSSSRFAALRDTVCERAERVVAAWRGPLETIDEALASVA
jgi:serine/threonine-protein kinase